jgi:DNA-binding MarR family transcriptional regulator
MAPFATLYIVLVKYSLKISRNAPDWGTIPLDKLKITATMLIMLMINKESNLTGQSNSEHVNVDDWGVLAQFSQIFRSVSDTFTEQVDASRGQAMVLCTVALADGLTQSEIADQLSVQGATVTTMLQKMEEAGLVIRRRDPDDNRLVRVYLTEAGFQKERVINAQFGRMQELVFKGMSLEERALLRRWLQQIIANIS